MQSKNVPEVLKSGDKYIPDGKVLVDMGFNIDYNPEAGLLLISPGRTLDEMEDIGFVCNVVEQFGFSLMQATAKQALFYRD